MSTTDIVSGSHSLRRCHPLPHRHLTPGMVSTSIGALCWASWKALMLLYATSNAAVTSGGSTGSGSDCRV